ncbi:branched-chain amino acid ABC transporter permease [Arenibaculum pallidiluteum]|uniref:branched-chain amino acid ABC transporter permease n=1 Tax=Arenibaculum pallidiluteum TaxID=2812559 RepID=UPI001A97C688|nr:branched-chain amino acid ABC transporter permease [Arenibaculum pallidiluteum]
MRFYILLSLNALTVASLYFLVASGFSLIFGLLRTVNMAHGAFYLLGAYVGYDIASYSGSWVLGLVGAAVAVAAVGLAMHQLLLRTLGNDELRQALVTIGFAIVVGDLLLAHYGGITYQFTPPDALYGTTPMPVVKGYPTIRIVVIASALIIGLGLWLLIHKTRLGMLIRAGVDDRDILSAMGFNVQRVLLLVFALGAGLAGLAGVIGGSALSISPGEDARFLLSSLVVVIVGGMGSLAGAALGALLIGFAEQFGLAFIPNYATLLTFLLMIAVLAVRPQGLFGRG